MYEMDPADAKVQNNLAQVSLLLDADVDRARKLAGDLHHREPSNVAFATTYAYALYKNRDIKGAVQVMAGLPEKQLTDPPVAAYYGLFLTATGDGANAKRYLKLGEKAQLLPQEREMLTKAAQAVP